MAVPLVGRLTAREYFAVFLGVLAYAFESLLRLVIFFFPKSLVQWFHDLSRLAFYRFVLLQDPAEPKSAAHTQADAIRDAQDFDELCELRGYVPEAHVVLTKDGYLLGLHRIPAKKGEKTVTGQSTGKPVVYLHHGLLMNSEVWVCLTDEERCLPFVLAEQGYDVWLGNNRGNKYSKKAVHSSPNSARFWNFSMDEFAWHDIPDSISYILNVTRAPSVGYVGFSQGTAQAFAALAVNPTLNAQVSVFVALAPALAPPGLAAPVVDGLMKASPALLFLLFGRKAIMASALAWQRLLYPPIFARLIDISLGFLFRWYGARIGAEQKIAAYAHLYSFTSTKAVVHWFQIMRAQAFAPFDDDVAATGAALSLSRHDMRARPSVPMRFPTRNIATPIVLLWGDADSLVDINAMRAQLPEAARDRRLRGYEHLDILWGDDVHRDVIPHVLEELRRHAGPAKPAGMVNGVERTGAAA